MSKHSQDTKTKAGRRDFLRTIGVGAAAGAAAIATAGRAQAKPETATERKKARYQETAHVKEFYRTARY
jgi:hypothetical protein